MKHRLQLSIMLITLITSGCSTSTVKTSVRWTHPDRDLKAYYLDDAACLEQANRVLFTQLQLTESESPKKSTVERITSKDYTDTLCRSNQQRDKIHYRCMKERGWIPQHLK